ncbi:anti-sigma regulatory factor (Ser/Thr protein kinase) [Streptacidiphilus sp. BW17]|uniref:ATP-binding protein n=1 Tax=Streptacidiphilus sp. BW17 TaxID=3156274 RepID=UPI00351201D1
MTGTTSTEERWKLSRDASEVGAARQRVRDLLASWGYDASRQGAGGDFELLVSETVTNAIRHGGSDGDLQAVLSAGGDAVTFAVMDGNSRGPARPVETTGSLSLGGRGMFLIETLADASGWYPIPGGKIVWFQLTLGRRAHPAPACEQVSRDGSPHLHLRDLATRLRAMRPRPLITPLAAAS